MKYSTLFSFLSIIIIILPWTGFPFGFLRLIISLLAIILFVLSIGLYQKEQKISEFIRSMRQSSSGQDQSEPVHQEPSVTETKPTERKKLADVLS